MNARGLRFVTGGNAGVRIFKHTTTGHSPFPGNPGRHARSIKMTNEGYGRDSRDDRPRYDRDRGGDRGGDRGNDRGNDRGGDRGNDRGGDRARRATPLSELDPAVTEVSRKVIGAAIEVHKALGPGFPLAVYKNALGKAVAAEGVEPNFDEIFEVEYDDEVVGEITADMFAGEAFLVKLMAEHRVQERAELRAQLRAADLELGLIINFGERRLKDGLVRVLNPDKLNASRDEEEYEDDDEE
jgi:GxxExxY protein